jgi:hypothetical protein
MIAVLLPCISHQPEAVTCRAAAMHMCHQAVTARVETFREDASGAPPYVQLVFEQPGPFLAQLQSDNLSGVLAAARGAHPHTTLGLIVLGLKAHIRRWVRVANVTL